MFNIIFKICLYLYKILLYVLLVLLYLHLKYNLGFKNGFPILWKICLKKKKKFEHVSHTKYCAINNKKNR